ncbi:MAG TPA: RDD family protein [Bacteroidia bacterium]|jgi:uncharacterized RDD family membrane protein YckC|nr:RDD family protein [Bacteroidia bacterium]
MDKVKIQTTQNIVIEFQLASVGDRILATLIDVLILSVYSAIIGFIMNLTGIDGGLGVIAFFLPVMFYSLICETFFHGKSFGKMVMKIQVVKLDGNQAKFVDYLLRWLIRLVDLLFLFGLIALITVIINGKGQRIGDIAAGTTVVKLKNKATIEDTILTTIQKDYAITFKEVSNLTDHDISIIKEVLQFDQKNPNDTMIHKLVAKTKKTMGIESTMAYRIFLETVVADYTHLHFED